MEKQSTTLLHVGRVLITSANGIDNKGFDNEVKTLCIGDGNTLMSDASLRRADCDPDVPVSTSNDGHIEDSNKEPNTSLQITNFTPPNGGYGWVMVFSTFVIFALVDGLMFSFGVSLVALLEDLDESTASVAALGGIFTGCVGISAPASASLIVVFGKRSLTIIGSAMLSSGLFASRFATNIGWLYLLYGVLGGLGFGFMVTPPCASMMEHFTTKRPLASGIAFCGSGVGVFVMNISSSYLLEMYGWQGAFMIMSALMMNGIPCALAIPRENRKLTRKSTSTHANIKSTEVISIYNKVKTTVHSLVWEKNLSVISNLKCACILLSSFFFGLASFVPFTYLPKQAVDLGMLKNEAAWITSSSGISNTLMRIGIGWIGSRAFANHKTELSVTILILDAVCFPVSLLLRSFGLKLLYAILYGALYGANVVLYPVMLAESVSMEKVDKAVGVFIGMFCAGGLVGVPLAGWTVDVTGDFDVCYILAGVQTFIAAMLLMIPNLRNCVSRTVLINRMTHF